VAEQGHVNQHKWMNSESARISTSTSTGAGARTVTSTRAGAGTRENTKT
jgi:hypothetical protein